MARRRARVAGDAESAPTALIVALAISLAVHILGLGAQLLLGGQWLRRVGIAAETLDVVYEYRAGSAADAVQERLEAGVPAEAPSATAPSPQIRIPERMLLGAGGGPGGPDGMGAPGPGAESIRADTGLGGGPESAGTSAGRAPVVDLTNLVEAAQGDPVLLSYFSIIRERIQQTANRQTWLAADQIAQGVVYLSFVLGQDGRITGVNVVADRSVRSRPLQEIALSIIKASSPFPPFPPSLGDSAKTVIVPLEFMVGS